MTDPLGPVVITVREIYDQLVRMTSALERSISRQDEQAVDIKDHESRLRAIEEAQPARRLARLEDAVEHLKAGRWPLPSLAALLALASLALAYFKK